MIEINWKPTTKDLRSFAALLLLFGAILGWIVYRRTGQTMWPTIVIATTWGLGLIGLILPRLLSPIYVGWMVAAFPIGFVVSHLVLASVFYLVVTPIGWMLRASGKDPMQRKLDRQADTYWVKRQTDVDAQRYFRQF